MGPCASGKSTLVEALRARGVDARHVAQEHSYVPDMWRRITRPHALIYLDVSYEASLRRRPMDWLPADHAEQLHRLRHARAHGDLYIDTDDLGPEQVLERALEFLTSRE